MAQSSDSIIKHEIIENISIFRNGCRLRIFPESSNDDQKLVFEGGLTFQSNSINYGSCDAGWFYKEEDNWIPFIGLEATDALNRGSSGNAQYQRFHHALGAVKEGYIGVYYLRKGKHEIQPDLYGMAYNASKIEKGTYLIIDDLQIVKDIIDLRTEPKKLSTYLAKYLEKMKAIYDLSFNEKYKGSWETFGKRRSTIIRDSYVIKYAARMQRNFTDGSQRAGHIAVGEMYLTKYFFPNKFFYYLFLKMTREEMLYLDEHKGNDKEWYLLRNEPNVKIITIDDIKGLSRTSKKQLLDIRNLPTKGEALKVYNKVVKEIRKGFDEGTISIITSHLSH